MALRYWTLIPETRWTYRIEFERCSGGLWAITGWVSNPISAIAWDAWFVGWRFDRFIDLRKRIARGC